MIEVITTPHSVKDAEELMKAGVDTVVVGEDQFGLRLPASFNLDEIAEVCRLAKEYGVKVNVAVNSIFHNDGIDAVKEYLPQLAQLEINAILLGDPGVVQVMRDLELEIDFIFDGHTIVTSSRHVNFWAKRGSIGAVMSREVPFEELKVLAPKADVPLEVLVYGTTCIHHSRRSLLENYGDFIDHPGIETDRNKPLYISEPMKKDTHYSIYEDRNGTHIFSNNDLNLMEELGELYEVGIKNWKLNGLFIEPETYLEIVKLFIQAKFLFIKDMWTEETAKELSQKVQETHPKNRGLDTGFFWLDPDDIQ